MSTIAPRLVVDHVSIAVRDIDDSLAFFRRHFPVVMGVLKRPGYGPDFNWCDFYLGRFKLELIESAEPGSFVDRFLTTRGPGFHHWSLYADRLEPLITRMEADGLRVVDKFDAGGGEVTAFVSPRSAYGVLIQFWQVGELMAPIERPDVVTFPLRDGRPVRMRVDHVSIAVRDIGATLRFFETYFPFRLRRPAPPGWDGTFLVASVYVHDYQIELIQGVPGRTSFVERFIERRGEGLHHMAIDVDDLDAYAGELEAGGVRIVDRRELRDGIKTAFISPRSAFGTLIQLWQPSEFRTC